MSMSKLQVPKITPIKREDAFASPPAIPLLQIKQPKYDPSKLIKFKCKRQIEDVDEGTCTRLDPINS